MRSESDTFWELYRTRVGRLLRPLGTSDGSAEGEIAEAERRLGLRLLREYYLLTGRREDINTVHNRLRSPETIQADGGVLVFCEENQGASLWGVDVCVPPLDDPAVLRQDSGDAPSWEPDFARLSQFLTAMLFVQAVNGGMRHSGIGNADSATIAQAGPDWEVVRLGGSGDERVLAILTDYGSGFPWNFCHCTFNEEFDAVRPEFEAFWQASEGMEAPGGRRVWQRALRHVRRLRLKMVPMELPRYKRPMPILLYIDGDLARYRISSLSNMTTWPW